MSMSPGQDIEEQAAAWIAARDRGGWREDDQLRLDQWIAESVHHRVAFLRLNRAWQSADRLQALREQPSAVCPRPPVAVKRWRAAPWFPRMAAAVLVAVVAVSPWRSGQSQTTAVGERKTLSLSDGSQLTLNTATRLRTEVVRERRRVWLDWGEAYFDIAHDAERPFEIISGDQRVVVRGTRFTLRRVGSDLQVSVFQGQVQVSSGKSAPVLLSAGAAVVAVAADASSPSKIVPQPPKQMSSAQSWLEGKLVFDRVPLADAAAQFNRYNRKHLRIADDKAAQMLIGGTFGATNVEAFARLLESSFGLEVVTEDQVITVRSAAP